jgi:ribosomal protein S18 acetylase RimI-like enzyme
MILEDLMEALADYEIIRITEKHYMDLYQLQKTNSYYFSCVQDHPVTYDEAVSDVSALPPHTNYSQKFFIGFYKGQELEAIMDYIEGYPSQEYVFIGLFIINGNKQRKGIGSDIIRHFLDTLKDNRVEKVRLGCNLENIRGFQFWNSMGFKEIDRVVSKEEGRQDWNVIVMEQDLIRR